MDYKPKTVVSHRNTESLVGGNILSLITYGMYASPLAIYREYLQNAADSIASSSSPDNGKVEIEIDLANRCVTLRDNGPGLSYEQAKRELIPVSKSGKCRQHDRGFRGIGRLSGLAFGDSVTFMTRRNEKSPVTQVIWNGEQLRNGIDNQWSVEKTVSQCVVVEKLDGNDYPAKFFEVQVGGISRYAAASILNSDAVRTYIGEVCPAPFNMDFPYRRNISNLFEGNRPPLTLAVHLDEETLPITRGHKNGVRVSGDRLDKFNEFEEIKTPALGGGYAAVGWLAHSSYLGALPKAQNVRCLRVRVGNIQVGSETALDHLFSENRFNRWCVGEIHILDSRIVPNARRDYLEPGIHLRNLENHLGAICRQLERRCRLASRGRNQRRLAGFFMEELEATYDLATSGYLTADVARQLIDKKMSEILSFREKNQYLDCAEYDGKLDKLREKLANFRFPRGRKSFAGVDSPDMSGYRKIFKILATTSTSPRKAKETIEAILGYEPN